MVILDKDLYKEIYLLISDRVRYESDKVKELVSALNGDDADAYYLGKIIRHRDKAKEYESLLERFEKECEPDGI